MRNPLWILICLIPAFVVLGCDSSSDDGGGGDGGGTIEIIGTSGSAVEMDGTWLRAGGCISEEGSDESESNQLEFDGDGFTATFDTYLTVEDCSGTPEFVTGVEGSVTSDQMVTITGWVDGTGDESTAPEGLEDVTDANGVTVTLLSATMTPSTAEIADGLNSEELCGYTDWEAGVGQDVLDCLLEDSDNPAKVTWVVDDSGDTLFLYESPDDSDELDADGYPTVIETNDPLEM